MARKQSTPSIDTRENLLHLAARMFGNVGYAATTMRKIAEQAGIEAASIYYHYASKEELLDAVLAHGAEAIVQEIREHMDKLPPDADAQERFRAAVVGQMHALVKYGDYALGHKRLLAQMPDSVRDQHARRRDEYQAMWTALLEAMREQGFLRPDMNLALCRVYLLGAITSVQNWFNPRKGSIEAAADEFCRMFLEGVGTGGPTPPVRRRR